MCRRGDTISPLIIKAMTNKKTTNKTKAVSITRKLLRYSLIMLGVISLGTALHELYHFVTMRDVSQVCIVFGDFNRIAYVRGYGVSSEIVAYFISGGISVLGLIFAVYDLFN